MLIFAIYPLSLSATPRIVQRYAFPRPSGKRSHRSMADVQTEGNVRFLAYGCPICCTSINKSGDVQLSSVLRILSGLDMVDRKLEGALLLRRSDNGSFTVSFAPNFGGGALEGKSFQDRNA